MVAGRQCTFDPTQRSATDMHLTGCQTLPLLHRVIKMRGNRLPTLTMRQSNGKTPQQCLLYHLIGQSVIPSQTMYRHQAGNHSTTFLGAQHSRVVAKIPHDTGLADQTAAFPRQSIVVLIPEHRSQRLILSLTPRNIRRCWGLLTQIVSLHICHNSRYVHGTCVRTALFITVFQYSIARCKYTPTYLLLESGM